MPRADYKTCKACGKHVNECGPLSWTRLCEVCALTRVEANNDQISAQAGPYYEHQQRRIIMRARQRLLAAERQTG